MIPDAYQDRVSPLAEFTGRLIFDPTRRLEGGAVMMELWQTPEAHAELRGKTVELSWSDDAETRSYVDFVTSDLRFSGETRKSVRAGRVHPQRLDGLENVGPLETLAGFRAENDMQVMLTGSIDVDVEGKRLRIQDPPIQVKGRIRCLVRFVGPETEGSYRVRHFDREAGEFSGPEEVVEVHRTAPDNRGLERTDLTGIERDSLNDAGWYLYGHRTHDRGEVFVVEAMEPRCALWLRPGRTVLGEAASRYVLEEMWAGTPGTAGQVRTVLADPHSSSSEEALEDWREGDRGLVLHLFGGRRGPGFSEERPAGLVTGHFSFGDATVVRDALSGDLRFEIVHRQIYANNKQAIVSGPNLWQCYSGDLERGWLALRPMSEVILKFPPMTRGYEFDHRFRPMDALIRELNEMGARYRHGDGDGSALISSVHSCVQDSNQALFAAVVEARKSATSDGDLNKWLSENPDPEQKRDLETLVAVGDELEKYLTPMGVRRDWRRTAKGLKGTQRAGLARAFTQTIRGWNTVFPRKANDGIAEIFLRHGARAWVIRTSIIGGEKSGIEPLAPTRLFGGADNKV